MDYNLMSSIISVEQENKNSLWDLPQIFPSVTNGKQQNSETTITWWRLQKRHVTQRCVIVWSLITAEYNIQRKKSAHFHFFAQINLFKNRFFLFKCVSFRNVFHFFQVILFFINYYYYHYVCVRTFAHTLMKIIFHQRRTKQRL